MRHWKYIGAMLAFIGEAILQVSGYQNIPLAIGLVVVMVVLLIWSAWPILTTTQLQWPVKRKGQIPSSKILPQKNNLAIVAKAIMQAKNSTPSGNVVPVYITNEVGLGRLHYRELANILLKLERDEKVIKLISFPYWLPESSSLPKGWTRKDNLVKSPRNVTYILDKHGFITSHELGLLGKCFEIITLDTFDSWYKKKR